MLQDLIWFLELTMYMEPLHSKKVRCVSHDTSHILNNPIITSEKKKLPNHHMLLRDIAKSGCQFEMMWISLWCFVLRSVLEGQQDMLTHHPLQSYPVEKLARCGMILRTDTVV